MLYDFLMKLNESDLIHFRFLSSALWLIALHRQNNRNKFMKTKMAKGNHHLQFKSLNASKLVSC